MRRRSIFVALALFTLIAGYLVGCASGDGQPHMNAAAGELSAARSELQAAVADKGGHRERAIALIDEAAAQVQAGIDYARTH